MKTTTHSHGLKVLINNVLVGRASSPCTRKKRNNSAIPSPYLANLTEGNYDDAIRFAVPSSEQLAALCCVSHRSSAYFIEKQVGCILQPNPDSKEVVDPVMSEILDNVPDGITVTKRHLEELVGKRGGVKK